MAGISDNLYHIIFIISIFAISLIIYGVPDFGYITLFLLVVILIFVSSSLFVFIKFRRLGKDIFSKILEYSYILGFSILATLIFALIFPYIVFHGYSLSIYAVQYIYLLPVFLVFLCSLQTIPSVLRRTEINYRKVLLKSLAISLVISIIISIAMVFLMGDLYDGGIVKSKATYGCLIGPNKYENITACCGQRANECPSLSDYNSSLYDSNLTIFNEIKEYQEEFLANLTRERNYLYSLGSGPFFCLKEDCVGISANYSFNGIRGLTNSYILYAFLSDANKELAVINSGEYLRNYSSLDEYASALKKEADNISIEKYAEINIPDYIPVDYAPGMTVTYTPGLIMLSSYGYRPEYVKGGFLGHAFLFQIPSFDKH